MVPLIVPLNDNMVFTHLVHFVHSWFLILWELTAPTGMFVDIGHRNVHIDDFTHWFALNINGWCWITLDDDTSYTMLRDSWELPQPQIPKWWKIELPWFTVKIIGSTRTALEPPYKHWKKNIRNIYILLLTCWNDNWTHRHGWMFFTQAWRQLSYFVTYIFHMAHWILNDPSYLDGTTNNEK